MICELLRKNKIYFMYLEVVFPYHKKEPKTGTSFFQNNIITRYFIVPS